ncbi:Dynactin subunit 6 [Lachnellula arida]|uniref:Dynactin subunit 6 n=1 Tax=Lachnellula arida TaxID=1316785 RepID=A0A8T9BHR5_9HELO|nr:Dynactin subunit 6 [Lachnellula arida]
MPFLLLSTFHSGPISGNSSIDLSQLQYQQLHLLQTTTNHRKHVVQTRLHDAPSPQTAHNTRLNPHNSRARLPYRNPFDRSRRNTAIHPRTKLISTFASITMGSNCIISERSIIGLQSEPENDVEREGLVLEDSVVVETGAVVEARFVGTGTTIEVGARIGKGAVVGKHCKIGPLSEIGEGEEVPDFTVIFGDGMRRIDRSGVENQKLKTIARQVEVLRKLIPSNLAKFQ